MRCEKCGNIQTEAESVDMTPTLNVGETIRIGKFKYEIVPSKQLCNRSFEPLAVLKRVE